MIVRAFILEFFGMRMSSFSFKKKWVGEYLFQIGLKKIYVHQPKSIKLVNMLPK